MAAVFESIRISSLTSTVSSFQCFTRRSSVLESAPDCLEKMDNDYRMIASQLLQMFSEFHSTMPRNIMKVR